MNKLNKFGAAWIALACLAAPSRLPASGMKDATALNNEGQPVMGPVYDGGGIAARSDSQGRAAGDGIRVGPLKAFRSSLSKGRAPKAPQENTLSRGLKPKAGLSRGQKLLAGWFFSWSAIFLALAVGAIAGLSAGGIGLGAAFLAGAVVCAYIGGKLLTDPAHWGPDAERPVED